MDITIVDGPSAADWLSAVGTIAAAVVASAVAVIAWRGELDRRRDEGRTALALAVDAADDFQEILLGLTDGGACPSPKLTSAGNQKLLASGALSAVTDVIAQLPPHRLPTPEAADAYKAVRILVRDFQAELDILARVPGSAGNQDLKRFMDGAETALATLRRQVRRRRGRRSEWRFRTVRR